MNLVAPAREFKPQFGGDNPTATIGWIAGYANLHAPPTISSLDSREGRGMQEEAVKATRGALLVQFWGGRAGTPGAPSGRLLVLAWLLRRQVAGLSDSIQIQPAGRKLRDLPAAPRGEFQVENLGSDHPPNGAFVHGEEVAAHPVPAFEIVGVVNADHHLQLGLSPEARAVRWRQSDSGIEVRQLELAVTAKQNHSGLVVRVFAKIIIRPKLKAHIVRARHLVGRVELQPFSAGADAVRFALIRTHSAILGACQRCRADHEE